MKIQPPIAFASAFKQGETMWIKKLYVQPTHQGKGIATRLVEEAESEFAPIREVRLLVNRDNTPAMAFYERKGFARVGETPVRMGDHDFVDFIYSKPIMYPCIS
jgi:diamine N-acetyltransferase